MGERAICAPFFFLSVKRIAQNGEGTTGVVEILGDHNFCHCNHHHYSRRGWKPQRSIDTMAIEFFSHRRLHSSSIPLPNPNYRAPLTVWCPSITCNSRDDKIKENPPPPRGPLQQVRHSPVCYCPGQSRQHFLSLTAAAGCFSCGWVLEVAFSANQRKGHLEGSLGVSLLIG